MSKQTDLEKYRMHIMKEGIAHIRYELTDINDIIHPFSIKNYEMLSDDFVSFFEKYRAIIPLKVPIVLTILGKSLSDEEKKLIDNTIWSNYCMHMTSADIKARACIKRSLLFLIYMILSVALIFAVEKNSEEIVTSFAYLPFWFFGYRLLIYLLIDCIPLWKDKEWYRQLASMNVVFCEDSDKSYESDTSTEIVDRTAEYIKETTKELYKNRMVMQYNKDKGLVELGCNARAISDIVATPVIKEREFMSGTLSSYLSQVEPFLRLDCRITFEIQGIPFDEEEKQIIQQAVKHYYGFRIATEEKGILDNRYKIIFFSIFIFASAVLLVCWGAKVDVATHEFIIMLFWFFADYLLEFILLNRTGHEKKKRILENCRDMDIKFNS